MDKSHFGKGVYRYFRPPIPAQVDALRRQFYPHLAKIANRWQQILRADEIVRGMMIERVGLKGKRHNGAEISSKHANFIVNRGGAGAAEILALMDMTRERVHAQLGIALEQEIRVIGE